MEEVLIDAALTPQALVVASDMTVMDLVRQGLAQEGARIASFWTVEEALRAEHGIIDLLVLEVTDVSARSMGAYQTLRKAHRDASVIVICHPIYREPVLKGLGLSAGELLTKPFRTEDFHRLANKVLEGSVGKRQELKKKQLSPLLELSRLSMISMNFDDLMDRVVKAVAEAMWADAASVMLSSPGSYALTLVSSTSRDARLRGSTQELGEGVAGWVVQSRQPLLIASGNAVSPDVEARMTRPEIASSLVVPLILNASVLGVLSLNRLQGKPPFSTRDLELATAVAAQIAGIVTRAREGADGEIPQEEEEPSRASEDG